MPSDNICHVSQEPVGLAFNRGKYDCPRFLEHIIRLVHSTTTHAPFSSRIVAKSFGRDRARCSISGRVSDAGCVQTHIAANARVVYHVATRRCGAENVRNIWLRLHAYNGLRHGLRPDYAVNIIKPYAANEVLQRRPSCKWRQRMPDFAYSFMER